ncbi:protein BRASSINOSTEROID INSENSITIVE 1-like [Gossypium australe]|uniref:Protein BRASSINOSTEROID INSENSITIVE 1-like n=1 Tax=Gossypium australe TaxID=47621 RepID=A0A5B6WGN9_9ROSI|nr:protein BRASSINOSTEROID INSENSITIVE 1-like [Gossypium australe]
MSVLLVLLFLSLATVNINEGCIESDRQALLMFKNDVTDGANRLSSWSLHHGHGDCCQWDGVVCDNVTAHVLELHLANPRPLLDDYGSDAENEAMERSKLRDFIGSIESLRHLDLSKAGFGGLVPNQLGNLSSLEYLNLRADIEDNLYVTDLQWLSGLSLIEHLDLSDVNLAQASNWLQVLNTLPFLKILYLSGCQLPQVPPPIHLNLSSLAILDLSLNDIEKSLGVSIIHGLVNLTSLRHLDLSNNLFNSSIPESLYSLDSLQFLNLGSNKFRGKLSSSIGNMSSAIDLDLSGNELEGPIPITMGNLCNLKSIVFSELNLNQDVSTILAVLSGCVSNQLDKLDLSRCHLSGQLTNQLRNFKSLKELHLSGNSVSGPIPISIGELSSLIVLELDQNQLKGQLPSSIGKLTNLEILDISTNLLEGVVSETHIGNLPKLKVFQASKNSFVLRVSPDWIPPFELEVLGLRSWNIPGIPWAMSVDSVIDLSFNLLSGPLPQISPNVFFLDMSNNNLSGSLSPLLCYKLKETMGTVILNLGGNVLSGGIPDCWLNWQNLQVIKLGNNRLNGSIPSSMGILQSIVSLHLQKNHLSGEIPLSLSNCTDLILLDAGENELHGSIPRWIGDSLRKLVVLSLRSNKFSGYIPDDLCAIGSLQVLDLADNNLIGSIPRCVSKFRAMAKFNGSMGSAISYVIGAGTFVATIVMKDQMLEYSTNLNLVRSIDLSNNKLSGEIPVEVTSLVELISLNLSHNLLCGTIPDRIGELRSLESVDFSVNKLSGSIPESMSYLTFLSHLNLSFNNLSGEIPSSTQLQSFDSSCYEGNQLCGLPVPNMCPENGTIHGVGHGGGNGNENSTDWFWFGLVVGFVIGFWSVFGPLVFDKRWRSIYTLFGSQTNVVFSQCKIEVSKFPCPLPTQDSRSKIKP